MDSLNDLRKALETLDAGDLQNVDFALNKILTDCKADADVTSGLVGCGVMPALAALVTAVPACQATICDLIAVLARSEVARMPAVEAGLVPPLVQLLKDTNSETVRHALRAIGNICFDNDGGRDAVHKCSGVERLGEVLSSLVDYSSEEEDLVQSACGCCLNLMTGHEAITSSAIKTEIPSSLQLIIRRSEHNVQLCRVILMAIGAFLENSPNAGADALREAGLVTTTVRLLGDVQDDSIKYLLVETLSAAAQNDLWKLALAAQGCVSHLLRQFNLDKDGPNKLADELSGKVVDLIVLLLTGDESLNILFAGGSGPMVPIVFKWVKSTDKKLLAAGALAVGNMARSDTNCGILLEKGVLDDLLPLLNLTEEDDGPVLHAALSALRNLSMPAASKVRMCEQKIHMKVAPILSNSFRPAQFKALGTLRQLVDKQEAAARALGEDKTIVAGLVELCNSPDVGVMSEAQRLLAALMKNAPVDSVAHALIDAGFVQPMVSMCQSEHAIMVHEAVLALNIVVVAGKKEGVQAVRDADVLTVVNSLSSVSEEISANVQVLVKALSES